MPKPILIIKIPIESDNYSFDSVIKATQVIDDYYVFVIQAYILEAQFQVFYEKDFDKVKYEEFKNIIKNINKDDKKSK